MKMSGPAEITHPLTLKFWKMHGLGNDYALIDNRELGIKEEEFAQLAKRFCKRFRYPTCHQTAGGYI